MNEAGLTGAKKHVGFVMKGKTMLLLLLVAVGQLASVRSQDLLTLRREVLKAHNDARFGYAQSHGIANMRQMVWDEVLAESAQRFAEECILKKQNEPERVSAEYRTTIRVNYIGQIVTARQSSLAKLDAGDVVNELEGVEYDQVIFPQTNRVGCGFSFCAHVQNTEEFRVDSTVVVCNYAPGYTADLEAVSQNGKGCSQCPSENKCFRRYLCSSTGEEATIDASRSAETPPTIPVITSMSVYYGSVNGGTRVDIRGRGLSRDLFSYQDSSKGYRVLFYNDDHQVECLVENYYSSSEQISCVTKPAPESTYRIRVYIDGQSVEDRGGRYCGGCRFRYRSSVTPQVYYTTSHGCLGDPVVIHGLLWTVDFLKMDEEDPDGDVITSIKLDNSFWCAATNGTAIYSSAIDDRGVGNVSCVPQVGNVVGSFDVSVTHSRFGNSMPISDRIGLSADGFKPYLYQVHADIEGVSPSQGSTEGGTVLTITGKGFYPNTSNDISVLVGGVKCEIINITSTEIQCRTGPQPEYRELYPGGRGILREIWPGYHNLDSILTLTKDSPGYNYTIMDEAWGQTGYPIPFNAPINSVQKFSGFLVPPATGRYTVDVRSRYTSRVYLSTDSDPAHKQLVAHAPSYTYRWDTYNTQRSKSLDLEGGRPYYLEMLLNQGGGPWHIYLGLKYHNSTLTRTQVPAEHEVQRVILDSVIVREKHAAVLGAVPRVLSATVSCNTWPNCSFRVDFNGTSSAEIPVTTSQDEMERAVNAIPGLIHYGVILLDADNSTDSALSINLTILLPPLQAESVSMVTIDGNETVNEVRGASAPERITLSLGEGKFSNSLDVVGISSNDVQEAIIELLSWQCDNPLQSVRDVYWSQDYEGEVVDIWYWYHGVVVSDTEPYCGRHSLLRPYTFYSNGFHTIPVRNQGFDVYTYQYVCFAYKGSVPDNRFHFNVRMQVNGRTRYYSGVLYLSEGGWETRNTFYSTWEYQCFDVYQAAQEYNWFDTGRDHRITWLGFEYHHSNDDFWIDNVSITSDEPPFVNLRNTSAVRPGGVFIRDITTSVVSWPPMDVFDSSGSLNRTAINQHLVGENDNLIFPWKVVKVIYEAHDCQKGITLLSVTAYGGCGQSCVNESQIDEASPPISGTFTVANSNGRVTKDIPVTTSAAEFKQFLEEIHDGVEFDVTEERRCHQSEWTIEWKNLGGDQDPLVVNHDNVEGVGISSTVVEELNGGILFRPVRGDMLRQPHPSPQVEVIVNKIPSSCRQGDCEFNYTSELTPKISSLHPSNGSSGTVITIVGEGFSLGDGNISVRVGEAACVVTDYNDTVITCTAGPHQAGTFPLSVLVGNVGYTLRPMGVALFTYQLTVSSVDHDSGSTGGGTLIRILGNGFPVIPTMNNDFDSHVLRKHLEWLSSAIQPHNTPTMCVSRFQFEVDDEIRSGNGTINGTQSKNGSAPEGRPDSGGRFTPGLLVLVGSRPCLIVSSALDEITCLTPPGPIEGGVVNISVCIEGEVIHLEDAFTYTNNTTPFITSYSPKYSNVLEDVALSFSGSQLNSTHQPIVVAIHIKQEIHIFCNVTSVSIDSINCSLDGAAMPPGRYKVGVFYPTEAHPSYLVSCDEDDDDCPRPHYSLPCFDVVLFIDSTTPSNRSYLGGTHLAISGGGFPSDLDNLTVTIGNKICDIVSVNTSLITCTIPGLQRTLNGFITDVKYTFPWVPSNLTVYVGDSVIWEWTSLFDIHQVAPPDRPRLPGFHRDPTESGSLTVLFTTPGEYPYGGYVDQNTGAELRAVVHVLKRRPSKEGIIVWAGPFRAMTSRNTTNGDDTSNTFTYDPLATPVVDWVWPSVVHPGDDIMLGGTGLDGDVTVTLMSHDSETEYPCTVLTQGAYNLSCRVEASKEPPVGIPLRLLVLTDSGLALVAPANRSSFIQLTPIITGIVSPQGSVLGGAKIAIMGYGFDNVKSVMLGNSPCTITGSNFSTIICTTPPSPTESNAVVDVSVVVMATYGEPTSADCDTTSSDCSYNYTIEATPVITSLDPTSIPATGNQSLSLTGMFLDTSTDSFTIQLVPQIGRTACSTEAGSTNQTCKITVLSTTSLTCTLPELCAGQYRLVGLSTSVGYSLFNGTNPVISIQPNISLVTPQEGSIAGGTVVSIYGGGFSPTPRDISILVDSSSCEVLSSSFTMVTFVSPPHPDGEVSFDITVNGINFPSFQFNYSTDSTPYVNSMTPTSGNHGDLVTLSVFNVPDNASVVVTIGIIRCLVTIVTQNEINCTLGLNYVGSYSVNLWVDPVGSASSSVHFFYIFALSGVSPVEGSLTGMSELVVTGIGFDPARSSITVCGKFCSISDSVAPPTSRKLRCILPPNTNVTLGSGGQESCDVVVTSLGTPKTLQRCYTYKDSLTSTISWVEPRRGGSAGGTFITIFGSDLDGNVNVTIGTTDCAIIESNSTHIICRTGASRATITAPVMVFIEGRGFAYSTQPNSTTYRYVDLWSSNFTWGGLAPPVEEDFVVVPKGQTLSIDVDTPILSVLLIEGGSVLFDDNQDVTLRSEHILIVNDGLLQVGTEEEPFQHRGEIVLYGHPLSTEIPLFGAKTLAVREGTLDLHGKPIGVTWTRLSQMAQPGDTTITLQDAVDWEVGGRIVIASTSRSQRENEEAEIVAISNNGKNLTISRIPDPGETPSSNPLGLSYKHISVQQTLAGVYVDTSAEVGYLTRNVVVRGNRLQEWVRVVEDCTEGFNVGMSATQTCFEGRFGVEETDDQFGSQIMLHAAEQNQRLVVGRIEYVEVTHAGQAFKLGRYPIHFHLNGDVTGSYVRGCAIHHTFNRAVTIHAVNNLLVEKNVAYNVLGHAYFLEDGVEEYNIIQDNLGVFVRASSSLLNVDITPATFWIVNPRNYVRGNAAAGGTHFGFWYRLEQHPTGPSATTSVCPRKIPLLEFTNNTAHSFGWYGLWVFPSYHPTAQGTCGGRIPKKAEFTNFLSWRNSRGVEFTDVGSLQLKDSIMIDNEQAGVEVVDLSDTCWGEEGPLIENVIVVGHTPSIDEDVPDETFCTTAGIKLPKSDYLTVQNVTFLNFDRDNCRPIRACAHCKVFQGGFESRFSGIQFENVDYVVEWQWEHEHVCRDEDGSLTGVVGGALLPHSPLLPTDRCQLNTTLSRSDSGVCDSTIRFQRVAIGALLPPSLNFQYLLISSGDPATSSPSRVPWRFDRLSKIPGLMAVLPLERYYRLTWENGRHLTNISYRALFNKMSAGDYLWFSHQFPQPLDIVHINNVQREQTEVVPNPTDHGNGDWHYSEAADIVYYLVEGSSMDICQGGLDNLVTFDSYKCFFLNCIIPEPEVVPPPPRFPNETRAWSEIWGNTSLGETDDITIEPLWHVVVDVPIPRLRNIIVYGVLQLNDTMDHHIQANVIYIRGGQLIAGLPGQPFKHKVTFTLYGNIETPEFPVPLRAPAVGSKAIGVFGQLVLNGELPNTPMWTHLAETVQPGDSSLTVRGVVDWSVGDEIVVMATSYEPLEAETFDIVGITQEATQTVIQVNGTFRYKHLSETNLVQGSEGTITYSIRAEVGLLTRKIRIQNGDPEMSDQEMFGCRVLVGFLEEDGYPYVGSAQLEGVEFSGCGQYGYTFTRDPRFALAFLFTGDTVNKSSYIHRCSFHDGYNSGVGVFGTNGLELVDNIVHNRVGHSIWMEGSGHVLSGNLAGVAHFSGIHYRVGQAANYQLTKAEEVTLHGNVAAGSPSIGFHVRGEPCNTNDPTYKAWSGNVAHSTLNGVQAGYSDGHPSGCGLYHDFTIYSCYQYGLFVYSSASVTVRKSLFVNNKAAIHANVFGPAALSHVIGDKSVTISNVQIMARSVDFTCDDDALVPRHQSSLGTAFTGPNGGHIGLVIPVYTSGRGLNTYPAINGHTSVNDATLANFNTHCTNKVDRALSTNPNADDAIHPISLVNVRWIDTPLNNRLFIHNPPLHHVNPSDCVDMDCDGHKHTLVTDIDGSFTGDGTRGTIVAKAEFEWDGDRRRGIGDYRIPKTMLTQPNGSRIPVESIYPNKGIVRGNRTSTSCTFNEEWNAYNCHSIEHRMIVLESLDADTEVRRLSPIGLGGNGYIDLLNGPQDHGWCGGYTCQERISTFYGIVATGVDYKVGLTSTNPQKFRILLLNSSPSDVITLGIIYTTSQKLEVVVDNQIIQPKHTELVDGELIYKNPEDYPNQPDLFRVTLHDPHGTNFYDRSTKTLSITLTGASPIEIHTSPLIQISMFLAPITVDEFFGENLRTNLAALLNIDKRRIRVVNVIAEDSRRRKRATDNGGIQVNFEIGTLPSTTVEEEETNNTFEELNTITTEFVNAMQTGELNKDLNVSVVSADVEAPIPPPVDPTGGVRANSTSGGPQPGEADNRTLTFSEKQMIMEEESEAKSQPLTFVIPSRLAIFLEPATSGVVGTILDQQPRLIMVDSSGDRITNIGINKPWRIGVEALGDNANSTIINGSTAEFINGWANYSSLSFPQAGVFRLHFVLVYPSSASFQVMSNVSITVSSPSKVQENEIALYVGTGVGGGLLIIIIVGVSIIGCFYLMKKLKGKNQVKPDKEGSHPHPAGNVYENPGLMFTSFSNPSVEDPKYKMNEFTFSGGCTDVLY